MNQIEQYYDQADEWSRLDRHKIEFDITKRYLNEYITGEKLKIFDIGGGPGRYAIYLAAKGHRVSLLDLSGHNIEVAREKSKEKGITLDAFIHGNALELGRYAQEYDVILLMGPLYHLVRADDRKAAVEGALRLLKPNGILVASFISNYAPLQDYLRKPLPFSSPEELLCYLEDGENREGFTSAYFTSAAEARKLMLDAGLTELVFAGVENVLNSKESDINLLEESEYKKWLEIAYRLSRDPNVLGTSEHFLYIGRK